MLRGRSIVTENGRCRYGELKWVVGPCESPIHSMSADPTSPLYIPLTCVVYSGTNNFSYEVHSSSSNHDTLFSSVDLVFSALPLNLRPPLSHERRELRWQPITQGKQIKRRDYRIGSAYPPNGHPNQTLLLHSSSSDHELKAHHDRLYIPGLPSSSGLRSMSSEPRLIPAFVVRRRKRDDIRPERNAIS